MDELVISQPDYGEQALDIAQHLVETKAVDLIVIDSVTALVPKAELEGDMGDSHMGLQARLMSQACRKLVALCSTNGVTIIFINQIREKVGLVFGSPEVTTGGRALKFFASVRLEIRRLSKTAGGTLAASKEDGGLQYGHKVNIKAVKNKVAMPFREAVVELHYGTGFQTADDLIEHAKKIGVLTGGIKLAIKGDSEKLFADDWKSGAPLNTLYAAVNQYYAEQVQQLTMNLEVPDEEDVEEDKAPD